MAALNLTAEFVILLKKQIFNCCVTMNSSQFVDVQNRTQLVPPETVPNLFMAITFPSIAYSNLIHRNIFFLIPGDRDNNN